MSATLDTAAAVAAFLSAGHSVTYCAPAFARGLTWRDRRQVRRDSLILAAKVARARQVWAERQAKARAEAALAASLSCDVRRDSRWSTVYAPGDKPVATLEARRVYDRTSPRWAVYATTGERIAATWFPVLCPATWAMRATARHLRRSV